MQEKKERFPVSRTTLNTESVCINGWYKQEKPRTLRKRYGVKDVEIVLRLIFLSAQSRVDFPVFCIAESR